MISISFGLAIIGIILLSLSMKRHYQQVWPTKSDYLHWRLLNRIIGYCLVTLSLVPCALSYGLGIGVVLWLSILAAAAFLQALLLSYYPKRCLLFGSTGIALLVVGLLS